jgi:uncharacterized membrane protein
LNPCHAFLTFGAGLARAHYRMNFDAKELTHLALRWVHVVAGILWVGTTYYFTWLDGRFADLLKGSPEGGAKQETDKRVWMVHSGGFYVVEKQRVPNVLPERLHWFRWEAAITWLSGFLLLAMVYYHGGLLVETEDARLSRHAALAVSLGSLIVAWLIYDLLWLRMRNEMVGAVISYLLVIAATYGLFQFLASRAACVQLGAMLGTIMTANVWMRILPAQRRMIAALKEGREPDQAEALRAKMRSKHNTFIVIPVVYLMLSPHFPGTYSWMMVSILVLIGAIAARFLRRA